MSKQSELSTFIHFTKSCLATGILAMPLAFNSAGLLLGTIGTVLVSLICTHCAYVLILCAHEICRRSGRTSLSFADVAEEACLRGPPWCNKYSQIARKLVDMGIFSAYFGVCSAYTVIMAKSFDKVISFYWVSINIRIYLALLFVPLLLLSYIPNFKYLTPVSTLANIFMATSLGITLYYLIKDLPSTKDTRLVADVSTLPTFFSITIFGLQAVGAVMPLENNMKRPHKFIGPFGVLNWAMVILTTLYTTLGFLGYLRFGDETLANITLNLPNDEYVAQAVQILVGLSVFGTFGIQFFICLDIVWNNVKHRYKNKPTLANYSLRTAMVVIAVLIALVVPTIGPFLSLIGALCFSTTGILAPIVIKMIMFWNDGFGRFYCIIIKDIFIILIWFLALVLGTKDALSDIIQLYV